MNNGTNKDTDEITPPSCESLYSSLAKSLASLKSLESFCNSTPAPLEEIEKLEQLRALYHGYKVAMIKVKTESFGIDTPEDLERAIKHHRL